MRLGDLDALSAFVGDLRSTLHKEQAEFNAMTQSEFEIKDSMLLSFQYAIDNAPTVTNGTYEQGFRVGAYGRLNEIRPQGEWVESHIFSCGNILRMRINVIEHKCKNCGRWSIKWVSTIPDNFCSNCGAYMRGDDNEQ